MRKSLLEPPQFPLGRRGYFWNMSEWQGNIWKRWSASTAVWSSCARPTTPIGRADLWVRIGTLMEIRDDLQVTAHVLQRRAVGLL